MIKMNYSPDLNCGNLRCEGTTTIPIKLVVQGRDVLAVTRCPLCHKKFKFFLSLDELDRWLPLIRPHIFHCENCNTPNPDNWRILGRGTSFVRSIQKTRVIKLSLTCKRCRLKSSRVIDEWLWSYVNPEVEVHFKTPHSFETPPLRNEFIYCGNCGAALTPGALFCTKCGAKT